MMRFMGNGQCLCILYFCMYLLRGIPPESVNPPHKIKRSNNFIITKLPCPQDMGFPFPPRAQSLELTLGNGKTYIVYSTL